MITIQKRLLILSVAILAIGSTIFAQPHKFNYEEDEANLQFERFVQSLGYGRGFESKAGDGISKEEQINKFLEDVPAFTFYYMAGHLPVQVSLPPTVESSRPDLAQLEASAQIQGDVSTRNSHFAKEVKVLVGGLIGLALGSTLHLSALVLAEKVGGMDAVQLVAGMFMFGLAGTAIVAPASLLRVSAAIGESVSSAIAAPKLLKNAPLALTDNLSMNKFKNLEKSYVYCKTKGNPGSYAYAKRYFEVHGRFGLISVSGKQIYAFATLESPLKIASKCAALIQKNNVNRLSPGDMEFVVGNSYLTAKYPLAFYVNDGSETVTSINKFLGN